MIAVRNLFFKCILLICGFLCLFLSSCGPSLEYQIMEAHGYYPTSQDLPNTRWVCHELNMYFDILDLGEDYMVGECVVDATKYRVVAWIFFGEIEFDLYRTTHVRASNFDAAFINCEPECVGSFLAEYIYEEGQIRCAVKGSTVGTWCSEGTLLTFSKENIIQQEPTMRWYCNELNMWLDYFPDRGEYYKGEIVIDGKICAIQAFEVGNNNYYKVSVENGIINKLKSGTSSTLFFVCFENKNGELVGRITDDHLDNPESFPYWSYRGETITFKPTDLTDVA